MLVLKIFLEISRFLGLLYIRCIAGKIQRISKGKPLKNREIRWLRERNRKIPKNHEKSEKNFRTNITYFFLPHEKQESTVYFVSEQLLFPVIYDSFAPGRSLYRETLTVVVGEN